MHVSMHIHACIHVCPCVSITRFVDFSGTMAWIDKLTWKGLSKFMTADRVPVYATTAHQKVSQPDGFMQEYENMVFYWILNAGHMVC